MRQPLPHEKLTISLQTLSGPDQFFDESGTSFCCSVNAPYVCVFGEMDLMSHRRGDGNVTHTRTLSPSFSVLYVLGDTFITK